MLPGRQLPKATDTETTVLTALNIVNAPHLGLCALAEFLKCFLSQGLYFSRWLDPTCIDIFIGQCYPQRMTSVFAMLLAGIKSLVTSAQRVNEVDLGCVCAITPVRANSIVKPKTTQTISRSTKYAPNKTNAGHNCTQRLDAARSHQSIDGNRPLDTKRAIQTCARLPWGSPLQCVQDGLWALHSTSQSCPVETRFIHNHWLKRRKEIERRRRA